jgi:C1A family cysteine protease
MVLLTGYGTDATTGIPYWLIKNQWGTSWVINGYMKISILNNCGIA